MTATIVFDLDSESASFEKIVLTNTTSFADPDNVIGYWRITGPTGVIHEGSYSSPDFTGGDPELEVAIPKLSSVPEYLLGGYTFVCYAKNTDTDEVYDALTITYTLASPSDDVMSSTGEIENACMDKTVNYFCQKITAEDTTNYGDYDTIDRDITLHPPSQADEADTVVSNADTLTYYFAWVNAGYELHIDTLLEYVDSSVTLKIRLTYDDYFVVQNQKLLADLYKGFNCYYNKFADIMCQEGGFNQVPAMWVANMSSLAFGVQAYEGAMKLGDWAQVEKYFDNLTAIIRRAGCYTCSCETQKPTLADPFCEGGVGSGSGTSYNFIAGSGMTISNSGGNITIGLTTALYNFITGLFNDTVESADGSVVVTPTEDGDDKTWDLSVKNSFRFLATTSYSGGDSNIGITISGESREGNRYVNPSGAWKTDADNVQVVGYPFASNAALRVAPAVFYIKDFLTVSGAVTDKVDIHARFLNAGATATDYTQTNKYWISKKNIDTNTIRLQVFDTNGLPISMSQFVDDLTSMVLSVKINE